jgi:hypothetical protein
MGAALTYARRYALFTLVGIAGEDDLDAPDLGAIPKTNVEPPPHPDHRGPSNGHAGGTGRPRDGGKPPVRPARPILAADQSALLRERLVVQLVAITSTDNAAAWAHRHLPAKNTLTAADAQIVEEAFRARLQDITPKVTIAANPSPEPGAPTELLPPAGSAQATGCSHVRGIEKSVLTISEPRRRRDKAHLKFVATQACLICGRQPSDPHHLRFAQPRALGRKVSDEFTVPLCRTHHRAVHRSGNEQEWWKPYNLDPLTVASALWAQTHSVGSAAQVSSLDQASERRAKHAPSLPKEPSNHKTKPIPANAG